MDDYYRAIISASEDPVTLAEIKEWIKQDEIAVDDALLSALISGMTKEGEDYTDRTFVQRTFEGYFSGLQCSDEERYPFIQIRRSPLISIASIEISIAESFEPVTEFAIKMNSEFSRVIFSDTSEMTDADNIPYPIKITFDAGYRKTLGVSSLTRSGTTVTATTDGKHGLVSGMNVVIAGADQADYNGTYEITVTSDTEFTYEIVGTPATPATGVLTVNFGGAPAVPEGIKTAIKEHVFFHYANRGDAEPQNKKGMPDAVRALYNPFEVINTF